MRGFWYVSSLRKQLRRDRILLYVPSATRSFPQSAATVSVSVLSLLHREKSAFCGRGEGGWRGPGAGAGPPAATAGASALQPAGLCPPRCPWPMLRPDGKGSLRGSRQALCPSLRPLWQSAPSTLGGGEELRSRGRPDTGCPACPAPAGLSQCQGLAADPAVVACCPHASRPVPLHGAWCPACL